MKAGLYSELRGFAPIGIMECWNVGIMGLKEFCLLLKSISSLFFLLFHYSSIALKLHCVPILPDALCFGGAYKHA